jgi:simple sugar transport system substrate-binding protein
MRGLHRSVSLLIAVVLLMAMLVVSASVPAMTTAQEPKYTFYFVSHIGPADPNMKWLTQSIEDASRLFPVKVHYVAPEVFSVEQQVNMLQTAIAAKPDGLIVPITDPAALDAPLREAINAGIPVIASNIADPRPAPEKIPYLTYVGGDEYKTGVQMAERILKEFEPNMPKRVACGIGHVGHVGAEMRCQGLIDTLQPKGVTVEKVALTEEPAKIADTWRSYLQANPDTEAIWIVTMLATPYVYNVTKELGLTDKVKIATVDESPMSVEGILRGYVIATHSQQFYLQGYLPVVWLYIYKEYGYVPPPEEIIGPVIIDKSTAADWKTRLVNLFGEQTYNELAGWGQ